MTNDVTNEIRKIVHVTCRITRVEPAEFYSHSRRSVLVLPRQVAAYLAVTKLPVSMKFYGGVVGRDHSSIVHAVAKIEQRLRHKCQKTTELVDQVWKTYQDRIPVLEEIGEVKPMDKPAAPAVPSKEVCDEIKKLRAKGLPVNRIAERVKADEMFVARMCGVSFWKGRHTNEVST